MTVIQRKCKTVICKKKTFRGHRQLYALHILLETVFICTLLTRTDILLFQTNHTDIINDCCYFLHFKLQNERIHNSKTRFDSTFYHFRSYYEILKT